MSMSMNLHGVCRVSLGEIRNDRHEDGRDYYYREIQFFDKNGQSLLSINQFTDNGYNLLIADDELAEISEELPLLKAA